MNKTIGLSFEITVKSQDGKRSTNGIVDAGIGINLTDDKPYHFLVYTWKDILHYGKFDSEGKAQRALSMFKTAINNNDGFFRVPEN